jgi:hypothetical protein
VVEGAVERRVLELMLCMDWELQQQQQEEEEQKATARARRATTRESAGRDLEGEASSEEIEARVLVLFPCCCVVGVDL